jgi:hypothetical protein
LAGCGHLIWLRSSYFTFLIVAVSLDHRQNQTFAIDILIAAILATAREVKLSDSKHSSSS